MGEADIPTAPPVGAGTAQSPGYGGFSLAGMALALPMEALREVVPCGELQPLPCAAAAVAGGLPLRGVLVPVLDLRRLFQLPATTRCGIAILVVHGGRLMGLLADAVTGVFTAADHGLVPAQAAPGPGPAFQASAAGTAVAASQAPEMAGWVSGPAVDAAAALWAGSLRRADDGSLVSLLSPAALAALPQVPMVDDPEPERQHAGAHPDALAAAGEDAAGGLPMMLMRCGAVALALDAMAVHATVPEPRIEPSVLAQGPCLGVIERGGVKIPAVDLLSLSGLGRHDPADARQAFIVRLPEGEVALMIGEVVDVVRARRADILPVPDFAQPRPGFYDGALPLAALPPEAVPRAREVGLQYLVLRREALLGSAELQALARTQQPLGLTGMAAVGARAGAAGRRGAAGAGAGASGGAVAGAGVGAGAAGAAAAFAADAAAANGATAGAGFALTGGGVLGAFGNATLAGQRPMVCYGLDVETATPIEQISEILPFDPRAASFGGTGVLLGMVVVRGQTIPLMCLSGLLGLPRPEATPAVSVLVVDSEGERIGFAVPRLLTIEPAAWEPQLGALATGPRHDPLQQALHGGQLAQLGDGAQRRMVRVLELGRVARALQQRGRETACAA